MKFIYLILAITSFFATLYSLLKIIIEKNTYKWKGMKD